MWPFDSYPPRPAQRFEQYFTWAQSRAHLRRQAKGRAQAAQVFCGNAALGSVRPVLADFMSAARDGPGAARPAGWEGRAGRGPPRSTARAGAPGSCRPGASRASPATARRRRPRLRRAGRRRGARGSGRASPRASSPRAGSIRRRSRRGSGPGPRPCGSVRSRPGRAGRRRRRTPRVQAPAALRIDHAG